MSKKNVKAADVREACRRVESRLKRGDPNFKAMLEEMANTPKRDLSPMSAIKDFGIADFRVRGGRAGLFLIVVETHTKNKKS